MTEQGRFSCAERGLGYCTEKSVCVRLLVRLAKPLPLEDCHRGLQDYSEALRREVLKSAEVY